MAQKSKVCFCEAWTKAVYLVPDGYITKCLLIGTVFVRLTTNIFS